MITPAVLNRCIDAVDCCPWGASAGRRGRTAAGGARRPALYTPEERRRRDASPWTVVQGVLAPFQFAVFLLSLALVLHCLATGEGFALATASVVAKTLVLYT
ncbi:MAG: 2-vinyl bacteriochlorophyllide hydratase, partial [Acetobacteraceae bacterium]|nr:2-vinyl bacteriochlorophyllide hydratase [Acetobacteraceae bacterium]